MSWGSQAPERQSIAQVLLAYSIAGPLSVRQLGEVAQAQILGADTAGPSPYLCRNPRDRKPALPWCSGKSPRADAHLL